VKSVMKCVIRHSSCDESRQVLGLMERNDVSVSFLYKQVQLGHK
jgi:hypothetical protein